MISSCVSGLTTLTSSKNAYGIISWFTRNAEIDNDNVSE
jgi:hypothetical protein